MAFLNPLLLGAMAAISVPIIIHLLTKRKIQHVVWAAMQFLHISVQRNQRRINLEDLILLALRCLLLILLALALARPAFRKAEAGFLAKGKKTVVLAIDNSYSMSQTDGVTSRFDQAKKAAEQAIDALPAGSSAAVYFVSDTARAAVPEPTFDLNLARKMIRDGKLSDRPTDHLATFRQTLEVLNRHAAPKELIFITDMQASGWRNLGEIRQILVAAKTEIKARVIFVGEPEEHNLGVSGLRIASALTSVGQPVRYEIEVTNYGRDEAANVQVSLAVDGEQSSDEAGLESIPPGGSKSLSLFARFRDAGYHTVIAKIPADRLPADDQRTIAVRALKQINVLLVDGEPGAEPRDNETFFLEQALSPVPVAERANYFIKPQVVSPAALETVKMSDYEAIILANVVDFSDAVAAGLERYLRRGGGLIIFPGSKINANFYNQKLVQEFHFLPATIGSAHGDAAQQDAFFSIKDKDYEHPIVSLWKDAGAGTLATAHFYRAFDLKPETGSTKDAGEPQVVLRYADGKPAVMERSWGFGRVVLFSSSADTAWNDLPVRPIFVPLIHRVIGAILARQDEQLNLRVGGKFEFSCDLDLIGKDATISKLGEKKESETQQRVTATDGMPRLTYNETDTAGAYEARFGGDTPLTVRFATQADPRESKVEELIRPDLDSIGQVAQVIRWTPEINLADSLQKEHTGHEIWMAFIICALAMAAAETVCADRFSKSK